MAEDLSTLMSTWFVVTGMKSDPHECTRHFGLDPTEVSIQGDARTGKRPPAPHSSWTIKTKNEQSQSADEALRKLLNIVWQKREQINSYVAKEGLHVTFVLCVTRTGTSEPFYGLSAETVRRIGYFNAAFHMDL